MISPRFENVALGQELGQHFRIEVSMLPSRMYPTCLSVCLISAVLRRSGEEGEAEAHKAGSTVALMPTSKTNWRHLQVLLNSGSTQFTGDSNAKQVFLILVPWAFKAILKKVFSPKQIYIRSIYLYAKTKTPRLFPPLPVVLDFSVSGLTLRSLTPRD